MSNFPCVDDLRFHEAKRRPAWAGRFEKRISTPATLIDACVNAHAGHRISSGEHAANNLLFIVVGWRRRGENIQERLVQVAKNPECVIHPEKRASFARKWAKRLSDA